MYPSNSVPCCQRRSKSRPTGRSKTRPLCGMGVKQDAAAAPAEMARISRPGRMRLSGIWGDFAGFWIGGCNGLVGGPRVTPPPCLRMLEPVALAVQFQNMDMVREAIEKRASDTFSG